MINTSPSPSVKKIKTIIETNSKSKKESSTYWTKWNVLKNNTTISCSEKAKLMTNKKKSMHKWPKSEKNLPLNLTLTRFQTKNSEKTFPTVEGI